jgi:hypothetical protein
MSSYVKGNREKHSGEPTEAQLPAASKSKARLELNAAVLL